MAIRRYNFISIDQVENTLAGLISEYFYEYPEPVPEYQYQGGEQGKALLESALAEPNQTYDGRYLHRGVFDKAAALWRSITLNHPFVNGNKRMGLLCCHVFLVTNGYFLIAPQSAAVDVCVAIATPDQDMGLQKIAQWLRDHTLSIKKLEVLQAFLEDEPQYMSMVSGALKEL